MCQILDLDKESKVLDIGTGSGYQAAILSHLCKKVVSIEIIEELYRIAKTRLSNLGYDDVEVIYGDGSKGYKKEAPYDGIIVAAATEKIPDSWKEQLKLGGRIVYPKTENGTQQLVEVVKTENGFEKSYHGYVRFVPLVQKENNQ
jgi:protein-L-isoaspartate(D-aspartate) O-methyltransferase